MCRGCKELPKGIEKGVNEWDRELREGVFRSGGGERLG